MKTFSIISILSLFLISCGSIGKYNENDYIKISDAKNLEGVYKINPVNAEYRWYNNAYSLLNNNAENKNFIRFEIRIINENTLNIIFNEQNLITKYNYKIKKNGFVKITNKTKISGIPYLIGGIQVTKIELGKTKSNQLIINGTKTDESAVLLIPVSFPKENFTYKFEKIDV